MTTRLQEPGAATLRETMPRACDDPSGKARGRRHQGRVLAVLILLAVGAGMVWIFAGDHTSARTAGETGLGVAWGAAFIGLIRWVQNQGVMAAVWLIALQAVLVILVIPGPFFTLSAGFLFGLAGGSLIAVAGSTVGATIAYWIGHRVHCVRDKRSHGTIHGTMRAARGESGFASHPRLRLLARVVRDGGWKVVLSTRLLPFFPFKLSNYFFGWMRFPFAAFFWGTLVGLIPITMVSVSAGALASDLSGLSSPDLTAGRGWIWSLATLGVGLMVLLWAGANARARYRDVLQGDGLTRGVRGAGGAGRPDIPGSGRPAGPGGGAATGSPERADRERVP